MHKKKLPDLPDFEEIPKQEVPSSGLPDDLARAGSTSIFSDGFYESEGDMPGTAQIKRGIHQSLLIAQSRLHSAVECSKTKIKYPEIRALIFEKIRNKSIAVGTFQSWPEIDYSEDYLYVTPRLLKAATYLELAEIYITRNRNDAAWPLISECRALTAYVDGQANGIYREQNATPLHTARRNKAEHVTEILDEAVRLISELAPADGWKTRVSATKVVAPELDKFITQNYYGKIVHNAEEYLRRGYSEREKLRLAFEQNSARYRKKHAE